MKLALEIAAKLSIVSAPFLPHTAEKLQRMLNIDAFSWEDFSRTIMEEGHTLNEASLLFSRVEDELVNAQVEKLEKQKNSKPAVVEQKAMINFDDFTKLDIRIGEITEATKVPKTSKLLMLKVKVGESTRTVVSGIAEHYSPEELPGKKVSILINLEPRKIKGILSEGMILMAENAEGKLAMISPDKPEIESGSAIR
jgi:methionyl-tRNA synthetase